MTQTPRFPEPEKIVRMTRLHTDRRATAIRQIEAYWSALREGAGVPRRSQIDPRGLDNLLSNAFILERIAPGFARFRIAGSLLNELGGMEVRGMPFSAMFTFGTRVDLSAVLEHVFTTPAIAELHLNAETGMGRASLEGQMILLPLQSDLGDVSRILGALVTRGDAGRAPRKFEITGTDLRRLDGAAPAMPEMRAEPGFAETQAPFTARAPHLRLIKG